SRVSASGARRRRRACGVAACDAGYRFAASKHGIEVKPYAVVVAGEAVGHADAVEAEEQDLESAFAAGRNADLRLSLERRLGVGVAEREAARRAVVALAHDVRHQVHGLPAEAPARRRHVKLESRREAQQRLAAAADRRFARAA